MTNFNIIIETEQDLSPGSLTFMLLQVRSHLLACQTHGEIHDENGNYCGDWNYDRGEEEPR